MEMLINNTYKMKSCSTDKLIREKFHNNTLTDRENAWSYRFPVCKYKTRATLIGEILVDISNWNVELNVYDTSGNAYSPFYNNMYGNRDSLLSSINKNFENMFDKFSIQRCEV